MSKIIIDNKVLQISYKTKGCDVSLPYIMYVICAAFMQRQKDAQKLKRRGGYRFKKPPSPAGIFLFICRVLEWEFRHPSYCER